MSQNFAPLIVRPQTKTAAFQAGEKGFGWRQKSAEMTYFYDGKSRRPTEDRKLRASQGEATLPSPRITCAGIPFNFRSNKFHKVSIKLTTFDIQICGNP